MAACLALLLVGGWLLLNRPDTEPTANEEMISSVEAVGHLGRKLIAPRILRGEDTSLLTALAEPLFTEAERLAMDARSIRGFVTSLVPLGFLSREADE
jgi:hypothetical protein